MTETLESMEGTVNQIIFYNSENGYCVMEVAPQEPVPDMDDNMVTVVGILPEVQPGEYVRLDGMWQVHRMYGKQFKASNMSRVMPVTREGIERYLRSGFLKGVGEVTAKRIVDHFGEETLKVLDSHDAKERLLEVHKIGKSRADMIVKAWQQKRDIADVMMYLQQYQVGPAMAYKIFRFYDERKQSAISIIKKNPYQLSRDIHGIGFKKADAIALNVGIPRDAPERLEAALLYVLDEMSSEGHVCYPVGMLTEKAFELLEIDDIDKVALALQTLIQMGEVRPQLVPNTYNLGAMVEVVYRPILYHSEVGAANRIRDLITTEESALEEALAEQGERNLYRMIDGVTQEHGVALTDQQKEAVRIAITNKVSVLTGGPGTGKTTTLRSLIAVLESMGCKYMLASPTGRAAKRLSQATEREAKTIHRMLGFRFPDGFTHSERNPLRADFVVIDESSMLDIHLFYALVRALDSDAHLLLVGDADQLPSVGAGDVLRDLIRSRVCPVTRLNTIFRQARGSLIIQNAHLVNRGELPILDNEGGDFYFFGKESPEEVAELLVDVVKNRIPRKFGFNPMTDIQVLSPMYRTPVGVNALNEALQKTLNPPGRAAEHRFGNQLFRVGDKVMQLKNNYDKLVFNGDIGRVHSIDMTNQVVNVMIDGMTHEYHWEDIDQLSLAYACSVHRSQGSEYPVVVIPVLTQHFIMLQRNLLYTAITRARKLVVLIGTRRAIGIAVKNDKVMRRWTALDWRLRFDAEDEL